ncbi:MAG: TldD/PmbA family protein [Clostridia bacterium]|nr:TldD/PmbA family protein [Clostridia bacterium]
MSNINEFCKKLLSYAKTNCDGEFEVYAATGETFKVEVLEGQIKNYNVNDYTGISFRIKKDGKMGYASTTSYDEDGIPVLVENAVKNASIIEKPDEQFIFSGSESYPSPKVYGKELDTVTATEKIEFAKLMEKKAKEADPRIIKVESSSVISGKSTVIIKNSNGMDLCETSNFIAAYVIPIASDGEKMKDGFGICGGFDKACLDADKAVSKGVREAIDFLDAKSVKSASMRIIFRNSAMCDMIETFSGIFSSENAQRGLSMLAGKEGEKIAADCVTLIDDPTLDFGFGSHSFDAEGVAGQRTAVVENGVLKTLLYDLETAYKAGVKSTGNASKGGYTSPIGISVSNFTLTPGEKTLEQLTKKMGEGLIITEVSGLHAGANATTGDFSLMAGGYLVENGKQGRAVNGITVSGNFYELLKNIEEPGCDVYHNMFGSAISAPSVLIGGKMSVAGE